MFPTGAYQNISQAAPAGAAINPWMASGGANAVVTGLMFHEKSYAVVYGKLDTPDKGVIEAFGDTDPETGAYMRYMMYLDGDNDQWKVRWGHSVRLWRTLPRMGLRHCWVCQTRLNHYKVKGSLGGV